MQRWLILGAVIAALGALLYLHLELDSETPSPRTASGEPGSTSGESSRRWLRWDSQPTEGQVPTGEPSDDPNAAGAGEDDEAELPGTFSLRGLVTEERGQPLEDVHVSVWPTDGDLIEPLAEGKTDAQGRFRVRSLEPGSYDVFFERSHFTSRKFEAWALSASSQPLEVTLQPAVTLQGRVVDAAGNPLPGAKLQLYELYQHPVDSLALPSTDGQLQEPPPSETLVLRQLEKEAWAESDGTFIVDAPGPGPMVLKAQAQGFKPVEREVSAPAKDVWLVLGTGASIEVSVVDAQEQPVPQATVSLWRAPERAFTMQITTDEAGHGVLQGLEPGHYGVAATSPPEDGVRITTAPLTVSGTKPQRIRLQLEEGESLSGIVTNPAGEPIAGVELKAHWSPALATEASDPQNPLHSKWLSTTQNLREDRRTFLFRLDVERFKEPQHTRTGPDGRFTLRHLLPSFYSVSFTKEGYVLTDAKAPPSPFWAPDEQPEWLDLPAGEHGVQVHMTYRGRVSGRVVYATDGEPCPVFQINGQPLTRPDGRFTLTADEPGPHTLKLLVPGVGGLQRKYETRAGEDVDLGDLLVGNGRKVHVRVEDSATSQPIARVYLNIEEQDPDSARSRREDALLREYGVDDGIVSGLINPERGREEQERRERIKLELGLENQPRTDKDGTCLLPDVPTRPLVLTTYHPGYEPATAVLNPGEQELTLRLRAWATVQGEVRVRGEPLTTGTVSFYRLPRGRSLRLEVRNGRYSGHEFLPGHYLAQAECDSCPDPKPVFVAKPVDVPGPQGLVTLDFEEAHGATVEFRAPAELDRFVLLPGQPPPPSTVREYIVLARARHPDEPLEGNVEGRRLREVPQGHYTLFYSYLQGTEEGPFQQLEVEVPASGVLRLELPPSNLPPQESAATGTEP